MLNRVSMFGIQFHYRRSSLLLLLLLFVSLCSLSVLFWNYSKEQKPSIELLDEEENVNLIDLFQSSFQLVYQAGKTIQSLKQKNIKFKQIFKKKSFENLPSEPLTIADLLSHSILTTGLKQKFNHLKIISEEKDAINLKELNSIQEQLHLPQEEISVPFIHDDKEFLTVPSSSVTVWIDPLDATKEYTENLLEYVTVMLCVVVENQPTIGIVYAPFTNKWTWGWVGVDRSRIKRDDAVLKDVHQKGVDEIVISRSHAGKAHEILRQIYQEKQYKILPAAGSAYKTVEVLEEYADYYLHLTPIKKWDLCAPDAILRANHGTMTTLSNRTIKYNGDKRPFLIQDGILATYKRDHQEILNFLIRRNLTVYLNQREN